MGIAERKGYTFDGWYEDSNFSGEKVTELPNSNVGNKKLHAKWKVISYTITYAQNGCGLPASCPSTYTIETSTFDIPAPTGSPKTGYKYKWDKPTVSKGTTGNLIIKAEITPIVYKFLITNDGLDITSTGAGRVPINIEYDQSFTTEAKDYSGEGYIF